MKNPRECILDTHLKLHEANRQLELIYEDIQALEELRYRFEEDPDPKCNYPENKRKYALKDEFMYNAICQLLESYNKHYMRTKEYMNY